MDVLYIKGTESINKDLELKYSLRSLEKFGYGVDRVFITGECPDFIDQTKIIHLPEKDIGCPMINHWWKVTQTITKTDISDDFLLMYDDIFFTSLSNIMQYKGFFRGFLSEVCSGGQLYQKSLQNASAWLKTRNLTALDYELHIPIVYNRQNFQKLDPIFRPLMDQTLAMAVRSIYGNMFFEKPMKRKDVKIREATQRVEDIQSECFSVSDKAFSIHVQPWLEEHFKRKGKYEK